MVCIRRIESVMSRRLHCRSRVAVRRPVALAGYAFFATLLFRGSLQSHVGIPWKTASPDAFLMPPVCNEKSIRAAPRSGVVSSLVFAPVAGSYLQGLPVFAADLQMPIAPSGVNALPESSQAMVFAGIFAGLAGATFVLLSLFGLLREKLPDGWFDNWRKTFSLLGLVFFIAGVTHFTAAGPFEAIYPPEGTWGFWFLPGSAQFHVAWTGVAEIAGGFSLFGSSLILGVAAYLERPVASSVKLINAYSALGLFILVSVVTPANIYMYTHGALMVGLLAGNDPIPVEFHYGRAALQVVLLSTLWCYWDNARSELAEAK